MKKTAILIIFVYMLTPSFAQTWQDVVSDPAYDNDFEAIVNEIENNLLKSSTGEIIVNKQYERWKWYNAPRLDENGKLVNTTHKRWDAFYSPSTAQTKSVNAFSGNWESLGPRTNNWPTNYSVGIGRVNCIAFDPADDDIIYVGTPGGGLWRTEDGGNSWHVLTDGMPRLGVSGIAIDPSSPIGNRTIYILTGDGDSKDTPSHGVFKSTDDGYSWYSTGLSIDESESRKYGYKLIMHPSNSNIIFSAINVDGYEIQKTSDGGHTWENLGNEIGGIVVDIEFKPGDPTVMYASTKNGKVYKSENSGKTWYLIHSLSKEIGSRTAIAVCPTKPDYLYVLHGKSTKDTLPGVFDGFYLSTDEGETFTLQSNTPNIFGRSTLGSDAESQSWFDIALAVDPQNEDIVYMGGIRFFKSLDAGITWTNYLNTTNGYPMHVDIHALEFNGNRLYCGNDGGIFYSDDQGENWTDISDGLVITQFYDIGVHPNSYLNILCGAQDNGLNRLHGEIYEKWGHSDGMVAFYHPYNSNIFFGSSQFGRLKRSVDYGLTLEDIRPNASLGDKPGLWETPFFYNENDDKLYVGYHDIYTSDDNGDTWTNITNGSLSAISNKKIGLMKMPDENDIYVLQSDKVSRIIFKSLDHGVTWERIDVSRKKADFRVSDICFRPNNNNCLWITSSLYTINHKVYYSTDKGENYENITNNSLPNVPINCMVYEEGSNDRIYVGTDIGVYFIDNSTTTWQPFNYGLPKVEITDLEIDYTAKKLVAATYGRGIWATDIFLNDCHNELVHTGTISHGGVFRSKTIESSSNITSGTEVEYYASDEISLTRGFKATQGSSFRAVVDGRFCQETPIPTKMYSDVTGTYAGPLPAKSLFEDSLDYSTGITEDPNINLYPNPCSSYAIVQMFVPENNSKVSITIQDIQGKASKTLFRNLQFPKGSHEIQMDIGQMPVGMYSCLVQINEKTETLKFQVIR